MKLLVTRPQPQATQWVDALRAHAVEAHALPLIGIEPLGGDALHEAWHALQGCDLVVFVSPNAVGAFFAGRPADARWPQGLSAAAPGPGSTAALRLAGLSHVIEPAADAAQFDSEGLWSQLQTRSWRRVLIVRGDGGRDWLADQLRASGAEVSQTQAYRRTLPALDEGQRALLASACAEPGQHAWHFSSSQAIAHLEQLVPGRAWSASRAIASHPRIAERARQSGMSQVHVVTPSIDAVARLMQDPHLQSTSQ